MDRIRRREERELTKRVEALGRVYGIALKGEPDESDCWHALAVALAMAHVPAFEVGLFPTSRAERASTGLREWRDTAKAAGKRPVKLHEMSTRTLALMTYTALKNGLTTNHKIAKFVADREILKVQKSQKHRIPNGSRVQLAALPFETAKSYVRQLRAAWKDINRGTATTFQYQVVKTALERPYLYTPPKGFDDGWTTVFGLRSPGR